jgi:ribose-phosphate pyrophosphokinase
MKNTFRIIVEGKDLEYTKSVFTGGEVNIKIKTFTENIPAFERVVIKGNIKSSENLMELLLLKDAFDNAYDYFSIKLKMPYVPYARQDRVCNPGEALSIKVFANVINSMGFDNVVTYDNHSDVSTALINNCVNFSVKELIQHTMGIKSTPNRDLFEKDFVVSPDAGANKKVFEVSKMLSIPMIRADKTRDLETGDITGTVVYVDDLTDKSVLIIDDICDGGRTFIELAKVLKEKGASEVTLFVTHGIFSKGTDVLFENGIDKVITTNSFYTEDDELEDDRIFVINV